jgi:ABC-type dipeptide/oligopeptide/nickel transport system permease subunit
MATIIMVEASLSFLGIGVQPPTPAWGSMIADGRSFMLDAWWVSAVPGIAIFLLVLSVNLTSQGLRDAFDPRLAR